MLGSHPATATVAVKDLEVARRFYVETLGLTLLSSEPEVLVLGAGQTRLFAYLSKFAGTNQATAVTWSLGAQLESVVGELVKRGVRFEHYELPGIKRDGDLHRSGDGSDFAVAWFKDPDGNIHSLMSA